MMCRFIAVASPQAKVQRTSREEETTATTAATATPRACCSRWLIANNGEPRQWLKYVDGGSISVKEPWLNKLIPDRWALEHAPFSEAEGENLLEVTVTEAELVLHKKKKNKSKKELLEAMSETSSPIETTTTEVDSHKKHKHKKKKTKSEKDDCRPVEGQCYTREGQIKKRDAENVSVEQEGADDAAALEKEVKKKKKKKKKRIIEEPDRPVAKVRKTPTQPAADTHSPTDAQLHPDVLDIDDAIREEIKEFLPQYKFTNTEDVKNIVRYDLPRYRMYKKQGIPLRTGWFSTAENEQLKQNVKDFLALSGIDSELKLFRPTRFPDEKETILSLRMKFNFLRCLSEAHGAWSEAEFKVLLTSVHQLLLERAEPGGEGGDRSAVIQKKDLHKKLAWRRVAEQVQTRSSLKCGAKWMSYLMGKMKAGGKLYGRKSIEGHIQLIKEIKEMDVKESADIVWEDLTHLFGNSIPAYLQMKFKQLKVNYVPDSNRKSFCDIIDWLYEITLPMLEEELKDCEDDEEPTEQRDSYKLSEIFPIL